MKGQPVPDKSSPRPVHHRFERKSRYERSRSKKGQLLKIRIKGQPVPDRPPPRPSSSSADVKEMMEDVDPDIE